jgi:hypothetical protein
MAAPSCDVDSFFVAESGRFLGPVTERGRIMSWWASIGEGTGIPSETWPEGMGYNLGHIIWERSGAVGGSGWVQVTPNTGTTLGSCNPDPSVVSPANTTRSTNLFERTFVTDRICTWDISQAFNFKQQIKAIRDNFRKVITDSWEDQNRDQYIIQSQNKMVLVDGVGGAYPTKTNGTSVTDFPLIQATSPVSQKVLDEIRFNLIRNGADQSDGERKGSYGMQDGQPVFAVVMSGEAQQGIFQNGSTIYQSSRINQDLRYAQPSKLLQAYGVDRSYAGWFHLIDNKAPRYNWVNGQYVRVPFYVDADATNGTKQNVNPDYLTATYELVIVFLPTVMTRLIPKEFSAAGSGANFVPWNFMGAVQWLNIRDNECNPWGNKGYWGAWLAAGYMPNQVENGYAIMTKRCQGNQELITCTSYLP